MTITRMLIVFLVVVLLALLAMAWVTTNVLVPELHRRARIEAQASVSDVHERVRAAAEVDGNALALAIHGGGHVALGALRYQEPEPTPMQAPAPSPERCGHPGRWPAAIQRWGAYICQAARRYNLDADLIAAVIAVESGGDPGAVSYAGARGLMQIMPFHSCATFDPRGNILCGTQILRAYIDRMGTVTYGLAAYNAGPGRLEYGRQYAALVLSWRARFAGR